MLGSFLRTIIAETVPNAHVALLFLPIIALFFIQSFFFLLQSIAALAYRPSSPISVESGSDMTIVCIVTDPNQISIRAVQSWVSTKAEAIIIVVPAGSYAHEAAAELMSRHSSNNIYRIIASEENNFTKLFISACNSVTTRYMTLASPRCVLSSSFSETMIAPLESNPLIGVVLTCPVVDLHDNDTFSLDNFLTFIALKEMESVLKADCFMEMAAASLTSIVTLRTSIVLEKAFQVGLTGEPVIFLWRWIIGKKWDVALQKDTKAPIAIFDVDFQYPSSSWIDEIRSLRLSLYARFKALFVDRQIWLLSPLMAVRLMILSFIVPLILVYSISVLAYVSVTAPEYSIVNFCILYGICGGTALLLRMIVTVHIGPWWLFMFASRDILVTAMHLISLISLVLEQPASNKFDAGSCERGARSGDSCAVTRDVPATIDSMDADKNDEHVDIISLSISGLRSDPKKIPFVSSCSSGSELSIVLRPPQKLDIPYLKNPWINAQTDIVARASSTA